MQALISAYRMVGTRKAHLDPLRWTAPVPLTELNPSYYDLSQADMNTKFSTSDTYFSSEDATLGELVQALQETYCGTLGAEFMHLTDPEQRSWWQMRLESSRAKATLDTGDKLHILERLTAAEGLEKYLHARFVGQKRFSLEGGESLIVLLDELVAYGATRGVKSSILGMAHRGRLNVLVNIVGKPPAALFDEFDGKTAHLLPAGDVNYHKGFTGRLPTATGPAEVTLAFNPSHLEIVNPVVQGIARARAEVLGQGASAVLPGDSRRRRDLGAGHRHGDHEPVEYPQLRHGRHGARGGEQSGGLYHVPSGRCAVIVLLHRRCQDDRGAGPARER